jgi:hypoxanthine-guanine phosphoribosyltransferase
LGKTLIAFIIGRAEQQFFKEKYNSCNENWINIVINYMAKDCLSADDILKNNVNFITFNYDLSLERNLIRNINERNKFSNVDFNKFVFERIIHLYGSISNDPYAQPLPYSTSSIEQLQQSEFCYDLDLAYRSSQNLKLINSIEKNENEKLILAAREIIKEADDIYVLGYSFDPSNNKILGFPETIKNRSDGGNNRRIYFTTFGDDKVAVSRRAGNAIFDSDLIFANDFRARFQFGNGSTYAERSEKKVFDALNNDFW